MGSSSQEYWRRLTFLSPWDLPNPGIEPGSPALQADSLPPEPPGKQVIISKKAGDFPGGLGSIPDAAKHISE